MIKGLQPVRDYLAVFPLKALENEIFIILAQIFHLSLLKIWKAYPNVNYFSQKYIKRKIIPKRYKALALILKLSQALELLVIFSHFLSFFSKIWLKTPSHKSVTMET